MKRLLPILLAIVLVFSIIGYHTKETKADTLDVNTSNDIVPFLVSERTASDALTQQNTPKSFTCLYDPWDLYKAVMISNQVIKIEKWHRWNLTVDEFTYKKDLCVYNTVNDSSFHWLDDNHFAFSVVLQDDDNRNLEPNSVACFSAELDDLSHHSIYSYMFNAFHLYKAIQLSESIVKIEKWYRPNYITGVFTHDYDMGVYNTKTDSSFRWIDDDHSAFTIVLQDDDNSFLEPNSIVGFALETGDLADHVTYSFLFDARNLYKGIAISNSFIKIEKWYRPDSNTGVFDHHKDIGIYDTTKDYFYSTFKWLDDDHTAFTITLQDDDNRDLKPNTTASFVRDDNSQTGFSAAADFDESASPNPVEEKEAQLPAENTNLHFDDKPESVTFENDPLNEVTWHALSLSIPKSWKEQRSNETFRYFYNSKDDPNLFIMLMYDNDSNYGSQLFTESFMSDYQSAMLSSFTNAEGTHRVVTKNDVKMVRLDFSGTLSGIPMHGRNYITEYDGDSYAISIFVPLSSKYSYENDFEAIINTINLSKGQ